MSVDYQIRKITPKMRYTMRGNLQRPLSVFRIESNHHTNKKIRRKKTEKNQLVLKNNISSYSQLKLSTSSWCIYDSNSQRELGFRQSHQRQIASLTKIMTTICALQLIEEFNLRKDLLVCVTNTAANHIGTTAALQQGTWLKLVDLLYGAMLPSGNDASYLLAQVLGYFLFVQYEDNNRGYFSTVQIMDLTYETNTYPYVLQFLKHMNEKATKLGMNFTNFSNPHGLSNALNLSSAKDIITLSLHATQNTEFRKIMNSQYHRYSLFSTSSKEGEKLKRWWNTNELLKKGWQGVKTGHTPSAGCCLSSLKNGVYIVVLNCIDNDARFEQTQKLYNWYISNQCKNTIQNSLQL